MAGLCDVPLVLVACPLSLPAHPDIPNDPFALDNRLARDAGSFAADRASAAAYFPAMSVKFRLKVVEVGHVKEEMRY